MIIKRKSFENTFHFYFSAGFRRLYDLMRKERRWIFPFPLFFFTASLTPFTSCIFFNSRTGKIHVMDLDFFRWCLTHERRLKFFLHMLCNKCKRIMISNWLQFPSLQWRPSRWNSKFINCRYKFREMWHKCDDTFSIRVVTKLLRKLISENCSFSQNESYRSRVVL